MFRAILKPLFLSKNGYGYFLGKFGGIWATFILPSGHTACDVSVKHINLALLGLS